METKIIIFVVFAALTQNSLGLSEEYTSNIENARIEASDGFKAGSDAIFSLISDSLKTFRDAETFHLSDERIEMAKAATNAGFDRATLVLIKSAISLDSDIKTTVEEASHMLQAYLDEFVRFVYDGIRLTLNKDLTYHQAEEKIKTYADLALKVDLKFTAAFAELTRNGRTFSEETENKIKEIAKEVVEMTENFAGNVFKAITHLAHNSLELYHASDTDIADVDAYHRENSEIIDAFTRVTATVHRVMLGGAIDED